MDRREFLKTLSVIALGTALRTPLAAAVGSAASRRKAARSIIEVWVWGGPSHIDTFDPKPDAGYDYNGGYKAIPTNVDGIMLGEWLPKLAQQADKFSIIRSMTHPTGAHETATYLMQTGRMPGDGITYPAIGAVIAMMKSAEYKGKLPPYIAIPINKGRFSENGFLNERFRPMATGGNPNAQRFQVDGYVPPGNLSDAQIKARSQLNRELDNLGLPMPQLFADFDAAGAEAEEIMTGGAARAFDLNLEPKEVRDLYGRNTLGQTFLAARRLVEAGVPYITINASGWDSHKRHFETMRQRTADMDQGFAALLQDLAERKLLDSTLIWWTGEFGRTPKVDWQEPWLGGRNHYCRCFSSVVAGGGFKGGKVVGRSDERAENVVERPVSPVDLLWSIYELAGIDPSAPLPNPRGLELPILPGDGSGKLVELYKEA